MDIIPLVYEGVSLIGSDKPLEVGKYHPSSLMGCLRKQYYFYIYHIPYDFDTQEIFAQGNSYHNLVQKALTLYCNKHKELTIQNEPEDVERIYKQNGIELRGRMDCFIKTKEGKIIILEIKSINNINYAPKEAAIYQLNFYLHAYPQAEGILLYINKAKNDGWNGYVKMKEFKFKYDEKLFNLLFKRALDLHEFLLINNEAIIPPPEAYLKGGSANWECNSCPCKERCFSQIAKSVIDPCELSILDGVSKEEAKQNR